MDYQVCTHWNVRDLLRMWGRSQLTPPKEFQRGPKWSSSQKKLYVDSLLRGYPSPAFYFHCTEPDAIVRRDSRIPFGIVDGQQRLNALGEFGKGTWPLLRSPAIGPGGSKHFPVETVHDPSPEWCGLHYDQFSDELKRRFASLTLPVIVVKTTDVAVVRDLFIRLQAGTALSAQERRDAWPGEFPEFIKRLGGHPHGAPGLRLFRELVRGRDDDHRRLAAKAFLLWSHWSTTEGDFPDISSERVDDLYRQSVTFDEDSAESLRFRKLLTALGRVLKPRHRKWPDYLVLHALLFLEEADRRGTLVLPDLFRPELPAARSLYGHLNTFVDLVTESNTASKTGHFSSPRERDAHHHFVQWIQTQADRASSLRTRHRFFLNLIWPQLFDVPYPSNDLPASSWSSALGEDDDLDLDF